MKKFTTVYLHFQKCKLIFLKTKELIIAIQARLEYQQERRIQKMIRLQKEIVILKMNQHQNKNL